MLTVLEMSLKLPFGMFNYGCKTYNIEKAASFPLVMTEKEKQIYIKNYFIGLAAN